MKIISDEQAEILERDITDLESKVWEILEDDAVCAKTAMTALLRVMANIIANEVPLNKREPVYRFVNAGIREEVDYILGGEFVQ